LVPEPRSALSAVCEPGRIGVRNGAARVGVCERRGRTLVQVSGWPGAFDAVCERLRVLLGCAVPGRGSKAVSQGALSVFRVGPERLWLAAPADDGTLAQLGEGFLDADAVVTEIGHSRTVVRVTGTGARELLNRGLPVDIDPAVFPEDSVAQSVIHHMPVLVHRVANSGGEAFDVYVTSDYAVSFWEWLIEAAQSFGCEIRNPE
jgi:heterotetrameric sarcosine oxidase gamma subunit